MGAAVTAQPLALDSARWGELTQAYGTAEDVPRLLDALACIGSVDARAEVWFALWRTLHRPGEAYSASYAAAPHLLAIAASLELRERAEAAHLVVRIEESRRAPGSAPMPHDLLEAYAAAVDGLPAYVAASVGEPWSAEVAQLFAAALLMGSRHPELARGVLELGRALACPSCGAEVVGAPPQD